MSREELLPLFIGDADSRIFTLLRRPRDRARGGVLLVAPFGDEMNKSRKMLTDVSAGLVARGFGTLIVDPFGTGDSDGEFADASWDRWLADIETAARWSAAQGMPIDRMLAVRLGCVLGAQAAQRAHLRLERTVFWQPVSHGARFLDQFLRARVVASTMEHDRKETTVELRDRLARGELIEVAGYDLSGTLAAGVAGADLEPCLEPHLGSIAWTEIVRSAEAPPPEPSRKIVERARARGVDVTLATVLGEPFWSSAEIVIVKPLVERAVEHLGMAA